MSPRAAAAATMKATDQGGPGASLLSLNTPLRGIGLLVLATILFSISDATTKCVSRHCR